MVVELISVGTEILMGNIVNTNAAFLSKECVKLGLNCYHQQVVDDNEERLSEALQLALGRSDIVILSGGLEIYRHEPSEISMVLDNPNGTAPGSIIEHDGKRIILLPGTPNELVPMFLDKVKPYLMKINDRAIASIIIKIVGIDEGLVEETIKDLIDAQPNPTIAMCSRAGEVHLRISAMGDNKREARKLITPVKKEIKKRLGNHIYTEEDDVTLEKSVIDILIDKKMTFTCAESCTGGLFSGRMVSVPGASDVYKMGFITYANKAKKKLLGVKSDTLKNHGAVSHQCAEEMAKGAAKAAKADVAIAITGIAGPGGGTKTKPVGLVYIGCFCHGKVVVEEHKFIGNRTQIRESAVLCAIALMRRCLIENK